MAPQKKRTVSESHKKAMAEGRAQGRKVAAYLEALEANKPKRGRKRTPESIDKRLTAIDKEMADASSIRRLSLVQERLDLLDQKESLTRSDDLEQLESDFVDVAAEYGDRKGLSYTAWREVGVPAAVLKRAGIRRSA